MSQIFSGNATAESGILMSSSLMSRTCHDRQATDGSTEGRKAGKREQNGTETGIDPTPKKKADLRHRRLRGTRRQ
ncbi:MAG: hypothetical protein ACLU9S_21225 [Oscillospiraceae bacterium]